MARIEILSNVTCRVVGPTPKQVTKLDQAFSFEVPGHEFSPKFRQHLWDGRRHLFQRARGTFPTGLLPKALELLELDSAKDLRRREPCTVSPSRLSDPYPVEVEQRDYQVAAVQVFLEAKRGVLQLATGGGKTLCAAAAIRCFPTDASVLFVVHTKVLLRQSRKSICAYLGLIEEQTGVIGAGAFDPKRITFATVQSLSRHLHRKTVRDWLASLDLFIQDEAHHLKATGTFYKVASAIDAPWRLALTATPWDNEADRLMVEATSGPVLYKVTSDELIKRGLLAKPTVEILDYESEEMDPDAEWPVVYREGIVQNAARNEVLLKRVKEFVAAKKKTLVLVAHVWHGDLLSALFRVSGIRHEFVHASVPDEAIQKATERFQAGEIPLLIASPIFGEGVDVPEIEALVISDGMQKLKLTLQKVGRALRRKPGANQVTIVDFADTAHEILARHSATRIRIYRREKFDIVAV